MKTRYSSHFSFTLTIRSHASTASAKSTSRAQFNNEATKRRSQAAVLCSGSAARKCTRVQVQVQTGKRPDNTEAAVRVCVRVSCCNRKRVCVQVRVCMCSAA